MSIAIYPGSFDPLTRGHLDIAERASRLFDRLVVSVGTNTAKNPLLPPEQRLEQAAAALAHLPNCSVQLHCGLTVELARQLGASAIVRGVRNATDLDYEVQIALTNRQLAPEVETIFLLPDPKYAHISSSIVRELVRFGQDVSHLVAEPVQADTGRR